MLIRITQKDIDLGLPNECSQCAVARAISRDTGKETHVFFENRQAIAHIDLDLVPLPPCVARFIQCFDAGTTVEPLTFVIPYGPPPWGSIGTPDATSDGHILEYKTASVERFNRPVFEIDEDELDMRAATCIVQAALNEELRV